MVTVKVMLSFEHYEAMIAFLLGVTVNKRGSMTPVVFPFNKQLC